MRMRLRSLAVLALACLLAAGCGERDETETTAAPDTTAADPPAAGSEAEISTDLETRPVIPKPSGEPPAELVT
jgi:type IV pilus biogenesis protein CpaD/CtpE